MKRLTALVLGAFLAIGLFGSVSASGEQIESCSHASYNVWESNQWAGDGLHVCYGTNLSDLHNVLHTQDGLCASPPDGDSHDDWNNCINSAQVFIGLNNFRICVYTGSNYSGSVGYVNGGTRVQWLWPDTFSDSISSIKWAC